MAKEGAGKTSHPHHIPRRNSAQRKPHIKKGGSRRRAYTGREAAEARETEQRRTRRRDSIEQGRRLRYNRLRAAGDDEVEGETESKTHDVAKLLRPGRLILSTLYNRFRRKLNYEENRKRAYRLRRR